jgi:hypothetical protein
MNNYIICFWDKSKIQISEEMGIKLIKAIQTETIKTFQIDKSLYAVGSVEKIIPKEEAYLIFPDDNELLQRMEIKQPIFSVKLNRDNNQKQIDN